MTMPVFRDVAIQNAKKQSVLVDAFTEDAPILAALPMQASSHSFTNVAEKVITMDGAEVIKVDDVLPELSTDTKLVHEDLNVIGGVFTVGVDKAAAFGGPAAYFDKQTPLHIKYAGQNMENSIIYDLIRAKCINNDKAVSVGGSSNTNYSILCIKYGTGENVGLYSPTQFGDGKVFDLTMRWNGGIGTDSTGRSVYAMEMRNYFGLQLINERNYSAIVNIDIDSGTTRTPTAAQVERMIANARGSDMNTFIYMHPNVFAAVFSEFKSTSVQYAANEQNIRQSYRYFAGVPIITSYNFLAGTEANVTL